MATKATTFTRVSQHVMKGEIDFTTNTFKVALLATPLGNDAITTLDTYSNITNEAAGDGYTVGGVAQGVTSTAFQDNETFNINWENLSNAWANATLDVAGAVIYKDDGDPNKQYLVHYFDFDGIQNFVTSNISLNYTSATQLIIDQSEFPA
jgi:hypothetical protein